MAVVLIPDYSFVCVFNRISFETCLKQIFNPKLQNSSMSFFFSLLSDILLQNPNINPRTETSSAVDSHMEVMHDIQPLQECPYYQPFYQINDSKWLQAMNPLGQWCPTTGLGPFGIRPHRKNKNCFYFFLSSVLLTLADLFTGFCCVWQHCPYPWSIEKLSWMTSNHGTKWLRAAALSLKENLDLQTL